LFISAGVFVVTPSTYPILVVAYADDVRSTLASVLDNNGVASIPCTSFCDAENRALEGLCSGMLVDLASIIKSKGEEKIVAYTLTNFFPTLRVRSFGSALVPMAMPGTATQDKSLADFLNSTCSSFIPRKLRTFRRHAFFLSSLLQYKGEQCRGFTLNLSWGGAFIVDFNAERFAVGDVVGLGFPEFSCSILAEIRWIQPWGVRCATGIGVRFTEMRDELETAFAGIFKTRKEFDRDRQIA
jgi:hypothetical protein